MMPGTEQTGHQAKRQGLSIGFPWAGLCDSG